MSPGHHNPGKFCAPRRLHQALECGASPSFIPPGIPTAAQPSSLSWNPAASNPNVTTQEDPLDLRRQYLEQLFENSPDALIVVDSSFHAQCVNREFQRMFGYSDAQTLSQPIDSLILPPDRAAEAQLDRAMPAARRTAYPRNPAPPQRWHPARCFPLHRSLDRQRPQRRLLLHLSRHFRSQARRNSQLRSLSASPKKPSATQDLQQFFAAIHGIVDELMPARNFSIAIHDPESQLLSFPYFVDEQESAPRSRESRAAASSNTFSAPASRCSALRNFCSNCSSAVKSSLPARPALQWLGVPAPGEPSRFRRPHSQKLFRKFSPSRTR